MTQNFPEPILQLPEADIPIKGVKAYLSQSENHQIIFMEFSQDVDLPEHSHESQWGIVLEGRIELEIAGVRHTYEKGDRYFIPKEIKHSGKIYAGYTDITYFDQSDRYIIKQKDRTKSIKEIIRGRVLELGADVCGFAAIDRFDKAPAGFHPCDIFPDCKSVIVFGRALPKGLFEVNPRLIYSHFNSLSCPSVDQIAFETANYLEKTFQGIGIPIPCDSPYDYWNEEEMQGRGLLSMKHAAVLAGIGVLGKNTMLINKDYGNRLTIGCILTDLSLESDEPAPDLCLEHCSLCIKSCPQGAIENGSVIQKKCRLNTYGKTKRGFDTVECNRCRTVCPMRLGGISKKQQLIEGRK